MQQLVNVPLAQLKLSRYNVRRTAGGDISQLAASIRAEGLINQLTVARIPPDETQPAERYEVIAGGRRLAALQSLRDAGHLQPDHLVPVNIVDASIATEVGLAENTVRERMHPHDELVSFRDLAAAGHGPEEIAARFGVTSIFVQRRLRLANVSPVLLRAFREDKLNVDQMMAFTLTDDHAMQERVFDAARSKWELEPARIRAALTLKEVPTTDKRVVFVGLANYEAAGGAVRRDLFDDQGGGYALDEQLLDQLVEEKLQAESKALLADGWSFVHIERNGDRWKFTSNCDHSEPKYSPRELTDTESADLEEKRARLAQVEREIDAMEDDDDAPADLLDERCDERQTLEDAIAALTRSVTTFSDRQKAKAGALIEVDHSGRLHVELGLIPRQDSSKAQRAVAKAKGEPAPAVKATLAESMLRRLSAHRQIALQLSLLKRSDVALATLAHKLLTPIFYTGTDRGNPCDITAKPTIGSLHSLGFPDVDRSAGLAELEGAIAELRTTLGVPTTQAQLWPWLLLQPKETISALLGVAAVATVDVVIRYASDAPVGGPLATALDLDMAEHWAPTAGTFFGLVPKSLAIEAVTEVHGDVQASRLVPMKKDECAGECEKLMARSGWLPKPLRRAGYVTPKSATKAAKQADVATPTLKTTPTPAAKKVAAKSPPKAAAKAKPATKKAAAKKKPAAKAVKKKARK